MRRAKEYAAVAQRPGSPRLADVTRVQEIRRTQPAVQKGFVADSPSRSAERTSPPRYLTGRPRVSRLFSYHPSAERNVDSAYNSVVGPDRQCYCVAPNVSQERGDLVCRELGLQRNFASTSAAFWGVAKLGDVRHQSGGGGGNDELCAGRYCDAPQIIRTPSMCSCCTMEDVLGFKKKPLRPFSTDVPCVLPPSPAHALLFLCGPVCCITTRANSLNLGSCVTAKLIRTSHLTPTVSVHDTLAPRNCGCSVDIAG